MNANLKNAIFLQNFEFFFFFTSVDANSIIFRFRVILSRKVDQYTCLIHARKIHLRQNLSVDSKKMQWTIKAH